MKNPVTILAGAALALFLSFASAHSQEKVLHSEEVGGCTLSVEADERWHTLRLRASRPSGESCSVGRQAASSVLGAALSNIDAAGGGPGYESLFIGRLVDYPWLSRHLVDAARNDRGWDMKRGKPRNGGVNDYVAKVLSCREAWAPFDSALAGGGYRVKRASVEKVLVGRIRDLPSYRDETVPGRVPFDAQVWFVLEKRPGGVEPLPVPRSR